MSVHQMTPIQLQSAYRLAVQSSLVAFYRQSDSQAERLVNDWWNRLSRVEDIQSEMFLHDEALSTAADLARVQEVKLTDAVRQRYRKILLESTNAALYGKRTSHRVDRAILKQQAG
jgi:hypothetical protein